MQIGCAGSTQSGYLRLDALDSPAESMAGLAETAFLAFSTCLQPSSTTSTAPQTPRHETLSQIRRGSAGQREPEYEATGGQTHRPARETDVSDRHSEKARPGRAAGQPQDTAASWAQRSTRAARRGLSQRSVGENGRRPVVPRRPAELARVHPPQARDWRASPTGGAVTHEMWGGAGRRPRCPRSRARPIKGLVAARGRHRAPSSIGSRPGTGRPCASRSPSTA